MHDDPHIPDRLARDLGRLESPPAWPADDPVLVAARRLRGRTRRPLRVAGWSAGLAAAAGLAISTIVWFHPVRQGPAGTPALASGPASPATMLDAYRLTLILDRRETPATTWDADGNGAIDRADVDTLAARAVSLGEASS
ncbi:MAG: hypothetical protein IPJ41_12620 [Phycisphaerales bacterium]|nr:hypothetical protein [Phycisphaerales bacterium]